MGATIRDARDDLVPFSNHIVDGVLSTWEGRQEDLSELSEAFQVEWIGSARVMHNGIRGETRRYAVEIASVERLKEPADEGLVCFG